VPNSIVHTLAENLCLDHLGGSSFEYMHRQSVAAFEIVLIVVLFFGVQVRHIATVAILLLPFGHLTFAGP
jgi:hypothetical protein